MASTQVEGDFDNYDNCKCDDGWEIDPATGKRRKGRLGGCYPCVKCGGVGLVRDVKKK
jgi:hypothetical protein